MNILCCMEPQKALPENMIIRAKAFLFAFCFVRYVFDNIRALYGRTRRIRQIMVAKHPPIKPPNPNKGC